MKAFSSKHFFSSKKVVMCGGSYLLEELASGKLEVGIVGNGHGFGSPVVKGRRSSRSDSQVEYSFRYVGNFKLSSTLHSPNDYGLDPWRLLFLGFLTLLPTKTKKNYKNAVGNLFSNFHTAFFRKKYHFYKNN